MCLPVVVNRIDQLGVVKLTFDRTKVRVIAFRLLLVIVAGVHVGRHLSMTVDEDGTLGHQKKFTVWIVTGVLDPGVVFRRPFGQSTTATVAADEIVVA